MFFYGLVWDVGTYIISFNGVIESTACARTQSINFLKLFSNVFIWKPSPTFFTHIHDTETNTNQLVKKTKITNARHLKYCTFQLIFEGASICNVRTSLFTSQKLNTNANRRVFPPPHLQNA